jgi:hypothetical protein
MVADRGGAPAIVICTGHGPLLVSGAGHGLPAKPSGSKSSGSCPFAGHGGPALAPALIHFSAVAVAHTPRSDGAPRGFWIERRLAAPPPPSHAPPRLLI